MKTKKYTILFAGLSLFIGAAFTAHAQTQNYATNSYENTSGAVVGPQFKDWEFTLGGSGSSNKKLDNSLGGVNASVGYYVTDSLEVVGRQSVSYTNGSGGGADYDGSTFVALDYNIGKDRLRPFVGINFGGLYGDNTTDTFAAGLEGGLKFYVQPKTFIYALVNYAWTFDNSNGVTDNFDDGAFLWSVGVGFNF